jgi:succinate-semialdehyde dehydrogenase / glutarate-semialdehyde dehydrogenase
VFIQTGPYTRKKGFAFRQILEYGFNDRISLILVAVILGLENGKTLAEARGEVEYAAAFNKWFAEEAPRTYDEMIPSAISNDRFVYTTREPVGVCAIITPWNFPAAMITRKIAPALAAGCYQTRI